MDDFLDW